MNRTRMLLIALLLLCSGAWYYNYLRVLEDERIVARATSVRLAALDRAQIQKRSPIVRPFDDRTMTDMVPKAYPRPLSVWQSNEKEFYQKLLSNSQYDFLIVPFQVQEYAVDRPTRSLMTAELALAIANAQKSPVPDPYLVARALGDGERRIEPNDVYRLAEKVGAKRIIWGYVGHNLSNKMTLTISVQERRRNGELNAQTAFLTRNFENVSFSEENPPIEIYQSLLPEVLKMLGFDASGFTLSKQESRFDATELPVSPKGMISEKPEPARDAYYFQLLAYLTPSYAERTKERFVEKSMLAILNMSPASSDYRALKARALMQLGLRPAAIQTLGDPVTVEEKELFAVLNGNLPETENFASQLKPAMKKFIAKLDTNAISSNYNVITRKKSIDDANLLKLPGKIWPLLAVRAFTDWDDWSQQQNIILKQLLDYEFPVQGFSAEEMIRGTASLGDMNKVQTMADLSVLNHVRKLLNTEPKKWCSKGPIASPTELDYLDLIEATATDNLMRRAKFFASTQGTPDRSLEFLNQIESVYKDHPQFALLRASAESAMAASTDGVAQEGHMKSAYASAFNAMYWERGQTRTATDAFHLLGNLRRHDYGYFDNFYASDHPFHSFYPYWGRGGNVEYQIANAQAALRNSTSNFQPVRDLNWLLEHSPGKSREMDAIVKSIENRFAGNPDRAILMAENSVSKGDLKAAEGYYREGIKAQPRYWKSYMDLGTLLFEGGQAEKAATLFMGYPGFQKGSSENRVEISNYAYEAGSLFYWSGNFSLATSLYRVVVAQKTGAESEMSSGLRLKLIDGDLAGAMIGSFERAKRYNSSYAYRDYLGMLHATGHSKDAWNLFDILISQLDRPHVWETALVGHRMAGFTEPQLASWVKQDAMRNAGVESSYAANYLLRANVTDRAPSKEFASLLAEIDRPVWKLGDGINLVARVSRDGGRQYVLGPVASEGAILPNNLFENTRKTRVKSDLVYFAEAYRAMRMGEFETARTTLQEASTLYDLSQTTLGYMLPYYAFAAAKSGDVSAVEKMLDNFKIEHQRFDYYLARGVIAGIGGKTDESLQFLKIALHRRPYTENRPLFTEHEYAEICEWLYDATHNPKYRDIALDWAKKNQKLQPWFSWPYAMEAKLSTNERQRRQAIAMTFYLDRNSDRLSKIPKREVDAAVREFSKNNPFLNKKASLKQRSI